jgi:hypothetical protein
VYRTKAVRIADRYDTYEPLYLFSSFPVPEQEEKRKRGKEEIHV